MPGCRALCHVLVGHASHPGTPSELHRLCLRTSAPGGVISKLSVCFVLNILQLDAARAALPRGKKKPLDVLKNIHEHVHGDGCHDAQCIFVQRPDLLRVGMLRDFHNQLTSAVARNAKSAEEKARVCMMLDFMIGTVTLKQHSGGVVRGRAQYAVVSQASSPPMPAPASSLPHVLLRLRRYPATDENMTFDELVAAASARACAAGSRPQRRVQCRRVEARSRRRLLELQSALRARARGQQRSRKRLKQQPCSQTLQMRRRVLDRRREPVRLHIASLAICSRTGNIQRAERTGLRGHCMDFIYAILTEKWSSRMLNIMLILSAFKNSPFHSQKL